MSFSISQIWTTNAFAVVTTAGITIPPGAQIVWNPTGNFIDGPTGSTRPTIFQNLVAWMPVRVQGAATFPDAWLGKRFTLAMYSGTTLVLQSGSHDVPPNGGQNIDVSWLWLMSPYLSARPAAIPFRWAGDFVWRLVLDVSLASITAGESTRLEIGWAHAAAPNGPLSPPAGTPSRVDMTPGYPIALWRLFVPTPTEFQQQPPAADVVWYIRRAVAVVWSPTWKVPRYDTASGAPYYVDSNLGGSFKLAAWVAATYPRCNCYDLAAIAQLAICLLMDARGAELADSRWVFQQPNGFINPGPLFRWVAFGGDHLRCNTPFWTSANTLPYVDPNAANRTSFGNHAWVEVLANNQRLVVDATHALQAATPFPPAAVHTRDQYLAATLDQGRPHGTAVNCWQNPDTMLQRIGVYNPWGATVRSRMALPEPLASEVAAIVDRGRSPSAPEPEFSSAILTGSAVRHALDTALPAPQSSLTVSRYESQLTMSFACDNATTLVATVHVHASLDAPIDTLLNHVSGFQPRPLDSVIHTCARPLGAYCFRTRNGVFWVRGNLFVRLEQFSDDDRPLAADDDWLPSAGGDVGALAESLDAYLARSPVRAVPPSHLELDPDSIPDHVRRGTSFAVALKGNLGAWAEEKRAVSSDHAVIVPAGPPNDDGSFELHAVGAGEANITIVGAETGSLKPVTLAFDVVVDDEDADVLQQGAGMGAPPTGEYPQPVQLAAEGGDDAEEEEQ